MGEATVGGVFQVDDEGGPLTQVQRKRKPATKFREQEYKCADESCGEVISVVIRWTWGNAEVTVGSGAVGAVGPKTVAAGLAVRPNYASRHGLVYHVANGQPIPNEGEN